MQFEDAGLEWQHSRGFSIPGYGLYVFSTLAEAPPDPEDETTRITRFGEKTGTFFIPWIARSMHFIDREPPLMLFIGMVGEYVLFQGTARHTGFVDASASGPSVMGELRSSTQIGSHIISVGMGRQVYRLTVDVGASRVVSRRMDQTVLVPPSAGRVVGFNGVAAFSFDEIYCVGWQGEICWYDGTVWHNVPGPTNLTLQHINCASDGFAYAIGQRGTLLRGRRDAWEVINHGGPPMDLWSSVWFADRLVVASSRTVCVLDPDQTLRVILDASYIPAVTCGWLTSSGTDLYSIGESHVLVSDDMEHWRPVNG